MSVYAKLNEARAKFHASKIKKSGTNSFANYKYYELADFLIPAMAAFNEVGLCAVVSFSTNYASMSIHETDGDGVITIESPMAEAPLKGCHPIQQMGAIQTYQRRYLWVAAMEIVEHDAIDASDGVPDDTEERKRLGEILEGLMNAKDAGEWSQRKKDASEFCIQHGKKEYADAVKQVIDAKKASAKATKEAA